jgi:type I site-specific restriction endonuclease
VFQSTNKERIMDAKKKRKAVKDIARVFKFELWLRFYFLNEDDDGLKIKLSEEQMEKIREEYSDLVELVEKMKARELTPDVSQEVIVQFIGEKYDGIEFDLGVVPEVMDSSLFRAEVEAFNMWVSLHEEQLDENFLPFAKWQEAFEEWKNTDQAKRVVTTLAMGQKATPSSTSSN